MSTSVATPTQLGKFFRLLGSNVDGERLASLAAIDRTLKSAHLDWHRVADVVERGLSVRQSSNRPQWQVQAQDCLRFAGYHRLKPIERDFLNSMANWPSEPSDRQLAWLNAIAAAVGARKAAS